MSGSVVDLDPEQLKNARENYEPRVPLLKELAARLESRTKDLLDGLPRVDRISFRHKGATSYAAKSLAINDDGSRKYRHPVLEIEDQVAGRVLVFFRKDMQAVVAKLTPIFNAVEHTSRGPSSYNEFAYESEHLVCTIPVDLMPDRWMEMADRPATFELQVRTLAMHAWAEPQHDMMYKPGVKLTHEERRRLAWAASNAFGIDEIVEGVHDAIETRRHALESA